NLYPANFLELHDKLYLETEIVRNPDIDKKIRDMAWILSMNRYEDEKYIIYPVQSIDELVEESSMQHNCVRTYCQSVANNYCQIYLMRKKEDVLHSFVTIEVDNNVVVQARTKFNGLPNQEINFILKKWEKTLVPIVNQG
ncbi:MAG: PcfJ domain-containing protein, partial [Bacilli bacterium]|nr:PcfJ domain-containing protein [Bacilli bacterium]